MDVRQDSPGPTYVRPSRRVDTRSTYRGWLLHRGVSRQVPLGLNATLTPPTCGCGLPQSSLKRESYVPSGFSHQPSHQPSISPGQRPVRL